MDASLKTPDALRLALSAPADRRAYSFSKTPVIAGEVANIPLTKGFFAIVDVDDLPLVSRHNWQVLRVQKLAYAAADCNAILMHRLLLGLSKGDRQFVDHIDGDGLNNRRSNLRLANRSQNQWNRRSVGVGSSKFKGVSWVARKKRWAASIYVYNVRHCLGTYRDEREAAIAYNRAASKYFGEFARLNDV